MYFLLRGVCCVWGAPESLCLLVYVWTIQPSESLRSALSLFFSGVGVGRVVVGGHIVRRVAVAQEDKMIAFVYVK